MNKSVLIIDDDEEFSELLRGIYEQADYTVHTAMGSGAALEVIRNQPIQLVVTDQRLPGSMLGSAMISKMREMDLDIPIIMVSGYLDDDSIRDLIRDGVEGIFIKPLNVFSLLKKSSDLLEAHAKGNAGNDGNGGDHSGNSGTQEAIGHIQGLSEKGAFFLSKAREAASFRRNLLLIGPPGTLFEEISRDISSLSTTCKRCVFLKPGQVGTETLDKLIADQQGQNALTIVFLDAENLSAEEIDQLIAFGDEHGGSTGMVRMIFCLGDTVESLYDQEKIDEELYLFLGTNELKIPALKDMPEDLVAIARREIAERSKEAGFDVKLRSLFLDHDWPENMLELRSAIVRACSLAQPMPPTVRHFQAAMDPNASISQSSEGMRSSLERFLLQEKSHYAAARDILLKP